MNNKGQTTVMFSFMISVLFLFTLTALEVGRIYMSNVKIIPCVHSMRSSIMADYNEELFERYHLLFMDPTYGTGSEAVIEEKMKDYLETSLNGEGKNKFYTFSVEEVAVTEKETILSNNMKLLKEQIADYEKSAGMVHRVTGLIKKFTERDSDVEAAARETATNAKELDISTDSNEENADDKKETDTKTTQEVKDPRDVLQNSLRMGILALVAPGRNDSREHYNLKDVPSQRYQEVSVKEKNYKFENIGILQSFLDGEAQEDLIGALTKHSAFATYVTTHFSNAVHTLDDSVMKCEAEYILKGKDNDYDNLEAVVAELTWLRMPVNYAYLLTDVEKKSEALTLATSICVVTGTEPLIEVVKYLLLGCWSYGESLYEMKILLSGEKIPYIKNNASWYTDLQSLTVVNNETKKVDVGLSYEDYLLLLLAKKSGSSHNIGYARILDMIEINLKKNNSAFCITDCVGAMAIQGKVKGNAMFQSVGQEKVYDYYFEESFRYEE